MNDACHNLCNCSDDMESGNKTSAAIITSTILSNYQCTIGNRGQSLEDYVFNNGKEVLSFRMRMSNINGKYYINMKYTSNIELLEKYILFQFFQIQFMWIYKIH